MFYMSHGQHSLAGDCIKVICSYLYIGKHTACTYMHIEREGETVLINAGVSQGYGYPNLSTAPGTRGGLKVGVSAGLRGGYASRIPIPWSQDSRHPGLRTAQKHPTLS